MIEPCEKCKKEFETGLNYKLGFVKCSNCSTPAPRDISGAEYGRFGSKDPYRGYNEGLGVYIKGKRHWLEEQKKRNVKSIG